MSEFEDDGLFVMQSAQTGVPAGSYFATFDGYEPVTTAKGDTLRWSFTITSGGPCKGQKTGVFIDRMPPRASNKLGRMLNGLAGRPLAEGETFNPKSVIGRTYVVIVTAGKDGKGTRVESVSPTPAT
jgi:hypothetical protein